MIRRRTLLLLAALAIPATAVAQAARWTTYTNTRFAFAVEYPMDLLAMQPPPDNDDGRIFVSSDNDIRLIVSGIFNALDQTRDIAMAEAQRDEAWAAVGYRQRLGRNGFILSGQRHDGLIGFICRERYTTSGRAAQVGLDIFATFSLTYAPRRASIIEPLITRMVDSFRRSVALR